MSKTKKLDETETTTENLVAQNELDGITSTVESVAETNVNSAISETTVVEKSNSVSSRINKTATAAVSSTKKMNVYKFLALYPQDIYITTLLKYYYPKSFFTKDQWFKRIEEILSKPINN